MGARKRYDSGCGGVADRLDAFSSAMISHRLSVSANRSLGSRLMWRIVVCQYILPIAGQHVVHALM